MTSICHITIVHTRYDVRIFHKECKSLSKAFEQVNLIVADGLGDEIKDGVNIYDIGKPKSRTDRFLKMSSRALKKAVEIQSEIYHLHDPELLRIALKLKKSGAKVIFDSHEDLPRQIISKPYIPKILRKPIAFFVEIFENRIAKKIDGIVAATPYIRNRFLKIHPNSIDINNYPILDDIKFNNQWNNRTHSIGYIGGIFKTRGIIETLDAIKDTDIKLILAGNFSPESLETECKRHKGWKNVEYLGFLDRKGINELLGKVKIGMVILEATPSYINSLPVKMFEYMAAGLPLIASNFPIWRQIITESNCGICVDQTSPSDIAKAIIKLISNNHLLKQHGINGRKAIEEKYNWEIEEKKLIKYYSSLL
ncbi:MAG: glycosyltransferase family 4 protein [Bacteroidales bacterium]|nr:glycosyltransferase family 4 protein [Bacteroidales bacterium]